MDGRWGVEMVFGWGRGVYLTGKIYKHNESYFTFLDTFMVGDKFKSCSVMSRWRHGESVGDGDRPGDGYAEKVCLERLGVGGNFLWCLVIIVIFTELEGAKRLGGLRVDLSSY